MEELVEDPAFLANGRCSRAELGFLSTIAVGRPVPAVEDAGNEVSDWERWEQEEERRAEGEELGATGNLAQGGRSYHGSCPRPPSWHPQMMRSRDGAAFFCFPFPHFLLLFHLSFHLFFSFSYDFLV